MNPSKDRIIVKRIVSEEKTDSGLYMPDSAQNNTSWGEVTGVYKSYGDKSCFVNVGSKVLFTKHGGIDVGNDRCILHENEILAYIE